MADTVKFLLADDNEENLIALEALLQREGLELLKARSGPEALELLLVHDVALALLDVQMPEMNGFELAELMRGAGRTKNVPIIFITAGAHDPQRVFKGYESGAVDFLFKPIDPHILKSKADVFFELHRQRIELANNLHLNEMFVGILGHDLRNPLASIVTGTQLLEGRLTDERQLRVLRRIASSAGRMKDMVEQLLDLTRARLAGGMGFVRGRRPLEVATLVSRAAEELRIAHPARALDVEVRGDTCTTGDASRLLQLFSNLVGNALHHGRPEAPVSVTIDGNSGEIVVTVQNAGAIPPEALPRIFDPFRGGLPSGRPHGLGLGLFICRQIAVAHGGRIDVESSEDAGTTFTVRLPRHAPGAGGEGGGGPVSRRVLVVEDDDTVRDSLREAFEDQGYETDTASNDHEALELLTNGADPPDAVILDLVAPVLDGGRLYEAMQADATLSRIPVIVSTSNPARAPAGATVLPKPVRLEKVLDALAQLWRRDLPV